MLASNKSANCLPIIHHYRFKRYFCAVGKALLEPAQAVLTDTLPNPILCSYDYSEIGHPQNLLTLVSL